MTRTPKFNTPFEGNSGYKDAFNDALKVIDALIHPLVLDKDLTTPPGGESEGDAYIVAATATGDWAGYESYVAVYYYGTWYFVPPWKGLTVYVDDESVEYRWSGTKWQVVSASSFNFVTSTDDLPAAVAGVITLASNETYYLEGTIDLNGARIVAGQNTAIVGGSSENTVLQSTGLASGTALLSSAYSLTLRSLSLSHDTAIALDATGNSGQALDWFGVNFLNCATIGTIDNYNNVLFTSMAFLESAGLTFDGTINTIGLVQCLVDPPAASTAITLASTLTIGRRFRAIYSAFIVGSGETGINASTSATIPVEGYILDTVNFSGGGTYTTGVALDDNKALVVNCRGIENSADVGWMYMLNNATATSVASSGVAYKVAGTTTLSSESRRFSHSNNRLTYTGALTKVFYVTAVLSFSSGATNLIGVYIAKNNSTIAASEAYATANTAGRLENITVQAVVQLSENDYIEVFIENDSAATDITVDFLNVAVRST